MLDKDKVEKMGLLSDEDLKKIPSFNISIDKSIDAEVDTSQLTGALLTIG
jgi:hypothetical protein